MRGEQGVSHPHGGKSRAGIVHAHDVSATQNGRHHRRRVTDFQRVEAWLLRVPSLPRFITMRFFDRPKAGSTLLPARRLKAFTRDDGLNKRFPRAAHEDGELEMLEFSQAGENLIVLPA